MKIIAGFFGFFAVYWLLWASFSFNDERNVITHYSVYQTTYDDPTLPKMYAKKTLYRVSENQVTSSSVNGHGIVKYKDCAVVNVDYWRCKYSDKSGSFGFHDGEYWQSSLNSGEYTVPELGYHLHRCNTFIKESKGITGLIQCFAGPF